MKPTPVKKQQSAELFSEKLPVTPVDATDRQEWDAFVTSHPEANFLQSWDFYEFHASRGNQVVRRLFKQGDHILATYAGVVENARRGRHLAIAGGPIMDWKNQKLVELVFDDIKKSGIAQNCGFVRVRPQLKKSPTSLALMKKLGLRPAPIYLSVEYAGILDLNQPEAEILKNASQGLRRKLRKAERAGIVVEKSDDPAIIHDFYQIQLQTARRQGFYAFSEDFLEKQFRAFAKNQEVVMYSAKLDGEILAQNFIIFYGNEASYHYGVSSELGTKHSAAPLLHLEAMRDARSRGCQRYNFWGIVGPNEKSHRFWGVSEFKRSFGVAELKYTPAHDLVINHLKYLKPLLIETVRKKIRHV